jgi:hypothetical protein
MSTFAMSVLYDLATRVNILIPEEQSGGFANIPGPPIEGRGDIPGASKQLGPFDVCLSMLPGLKA